MIVLEETDDYLIEYCHMSKYKGNRTAYYFGTLTDKHTKTKQPIISKIKYYNNKDVLILKEKLINLWKKEN